MQHRLNLSMAHAQRVASSQFLERRHQLPHALHSCSHYVRAQWAIQVAGQVGLTPRPHLCIAGLVHVLEQGGSSSLRMRGCEWPSVRHSGGCSPACSFTVPVGFAACGNPASRAPWGHRDSAWPYSLCKVPAQNTGPGGRAPWFRLRPRCSPRPPTG